MLACDINQYNIVICANDIIMYVYMHKKYTFQTELCSQIGKVLGSIKLHICIVGMP